eukprot:1159912-Pelagomonas_calceolata.AAC.2
MGGQQHLRPGCVHLVWGQYSHRGKTPCKHRQGARVTPLKGDGLGSCSTCDKNWLSKGRRFLHLIQGHCMQKGVQTQAGPGRSSVQNVDILGGTPGSNP